MQQGMLDRSAKQGLVPKLLVSIIYSIQLFWQNIKLKDSHRINLQRKTYKPRTSWLSAQGLMPPAAHMMFKAKMLHCAGRRPFNNQLLR
jgi:hypothetical protein